MKQKAVIKVCLQNKKCGKCRSKALQVAVGCRGIQSAAWKGSDGDELEVVGNGVDMVKLTVLIRKKVGPAELVSVTPVKPDS